MTASTQPLPYGWACSMRGKTSTTAILIAVSVAVGFLLAPVPNVEGMSAVSFFSGCLIGWTGGLLVGSLSMLLFSMLNPLGPAPFPVLVAQVLSMGVVGACGRLWQRWAVGWSRPEVAGVVMGGLLTLAYDVVTNYGVAVSMGRWKSPLVVIAAGMPFAVIHITSNALIFGSVGAVAVRKGWLRRGGDKCTGRH